jgi:hypothetical protein
MPSTGAKFIKIERNLSLSATEIPLYTDVIVSDGLYFYCSVPKHEETKPREKFKRNKD